MAEEVPTVRNLFLNHVYFSGERSLQTVRLHVF